MRDKILLFFTWISILNLTGCVMPDQNGSVHKLAPGEEYFLMKQFPEKKFHFQAYEKALSEVKSFLSNASNRSAGEWTVEGPGNIGARANTIAVDPKNDNIIFIGFSEGGLFRTKDGGKNWKPVFDGQNFLSIGDVVIDPNNSKIIYAGTGDPNISGYPFVGNGLYKSMDGGDTWTNIGLQETRIISQIRIAGNSGQILYVSAMGIPFEKNEHRGLYKSTDAGNTWSKVLYVNDSTGICDFVIHPENPNIIYAASWNRIRNNRKSLVSGPDAKIFKSENGGVSWTVLQNGLPTDASSRIGLDISLSNPNVLYACYTHPSNFNLKGIYKTMNAGLEWTTLPIGGSSGLDPGIYGGFGWYFGKIRINPRDENDVFILAVDMFRTKNGGQTWQSAVPPWWSYEVHADKHDLIFSGNNMYLTTDGGAYTSDITNISWKDIENIPTTQFYRVGYNPTRPDHYFGGAQDNGTSGGNVSEINDWIRIYGGDGFQPLFHPDNENIFYVSTQNGGLAVTENGGISFSGATSGISGADPRNWDMPIIMSAHDPDVLYAGTNKIYRNTTGPIVEWQAISGDLTDPDSDFLRHNISTVAESPMDKNHIVAGTSDGLVWGSRDNGTTWTNISNGLPKKYVSSITFSPSDRHAIYISYTGYKDNDNTPYIYRSGDLGKNWQSIQGNMPNIAINNILVLPTDSDLPDVHIVIATDAGVFMTADGGRRWERLGNNMPFVPVYDVDYNVKRNEIIAGTFGRSIQSFDLTKVGYYGGSSSVKPVSYNKFSILNNVVTSGKPLFVHYDDWSFGGGAYIITGADGRYCSTGKLYNGTNALQIDHLSSGIYFITDPTANTPGRRTQRFVKI